MEVEVAAGRVRIGLAPGVRPLDAAGRAVRRAMELQLARQALATPRRIGGRLVVRHVDRPGRGQRDRLEHPPPRPHAAPPLPEQRVRAPRRLPPLPSAGRPEVAVRVPARLDECQIVLVGNVVAIDLERLNIHHLRRKLVVPAERDVLQRVAQRGATGRHANHRRLRRTSAGHRLGARRTSFAGEFQPVVHVQQRLLVHHLVLEQRVHTLSPAQDRVGAAGDVCRLQCVQNRPIRPLHVLPDGVAARPEVDGGRRGRLSVMRIDPPREQAIQIRIEVGRAQSLPEQAVDGERRNVAVVED